jgi:hypothetical protein
MAPEVSLLLAFTAGLALGAVGLALHSQRKGKRVTLLAPAPAAAPRHKWSFAVDKVAKANAQPAQTDTATPATEIPERWPPDTSADARSRAAADVAAAIARAQRMREPNADAGMRDPNSDTEAEEDEESPVPLSWSPVSRGACATLIIFGADGNLSETRVMPTLADLWHRGLLPHDVLIFGYARPIGAGGLLADTNDFRDFVSRCCGGTAGAFTRRCHYMTGQFGDIQAVGRLLSLVRGMEAERLEKRREMGIPGRHNKRGGGGGAGLGGAGGEEAGLGGAGHDEAGEAEASPRVRMYYAAVPSFVYAKLAMALCENGAACGGLRLDVQPSTKGDEILAAAERSLPHDDVEERCAQKLKEN